jgi:hypothetical protein
MGDRETIKGAPITEEQIDAWSAEAEAGYDPQVLEKRGSGRPGRGGDLGVERAASDLTAGRWGRMAG